ncbi:uncharacterized protein LOC143294953 isoform X2 [Babylonia areolata]|uniref:uncharacterized protein LOC143294953 isoform X2 n=1 Tax=Babylonia areolata TaxID=304850 RepID=UPI003FD21481
MDFVDLDKVLDQFEEEEKAAEEILPGREVKPSGYAEYLISHQDRPWESLSLGQPLDGQSQHPHPHPQVVVYDDPYDPGERCTLPGHADLKQLAFPGRQGFVEQQVKQDTDTGGQSVGLDQDVAQTKVKEEKIEAYLPPLHLTNGVGQGTGVDVNGWVEGVVKGGEEGERRGLIASQPASIQTDTLSPASEQELLSYPLPKSDILVEGHGDTRRDTTPPRSPPSTARPSCPTDTEHYASSNSAEIREAEDQSVQHHPGTEVVDSPPADQQTMEMESDAGCVQGLDTGSGHDMEEPVREPAAAPAKDAGLSDHSDHQQDRDVSLQQELAAADRAKGDGAAVEAVGFEPEECDMDRDEMDAYLEELESSMVADCAEMSGLTAAACGVPPAQLTAMEGGGESEDQDTQCIMEGQDMPHTATVDTSDRSALGGDGEGEGQAVGVVSSEDSRDHRVDSEVADTSAHGEDPAAVCSQSTNDSVPQDNPSDMQQPPVLAAPGDQGDVRTDLAPQGGSDTGQQTGPGTSTDANTHSTSLGLSDSTKTEVNSSAMNLGRFVDTSSLEFPVAGNKNGVSSVVKGKLEIEGLLDEIVAARLAQKSSEVVSAESIVPGQGGVEQAGRTEGWGPEGSMVCSRVRESSSASPETVSPAQSGSPSPTLGIGARPKDPSHMKKNRPNSLLGLSKISLGSPFSPPQQPGVIEVMLPAAQQGPGVTEVSEDGWEGRTHTTRQLGVSPPPEGGAVVPRDSSPDPRAVDGARDEAMESPVMRRLDMRGDTGMVGEGEEASNGVHRPQSWSPSTLSSPPTQRTKRPTSLNLPVRQDRMGSLSPDGDSGRARKAGLVPESAGSSEAGSSEEESMGVGGTDGCAHEDLGSRHGHQEQEGAGAAAELPMETPPPSILHLNLGKIAPTWLPDADAPACMECAARFTFTKRRHHCRACGKIFCSTCCSQKSRLTYLENKEGRVCNSCHHILSSAHCVRPAGVSCRSPNPNNPIEYCSTVPPTQQANARAPLPTVMVPTGVLKRHGSNRRSEPKQVMFSDGIRPGGDLTELDGSDQARLPPRRSGRAQKKVEKQQGDHSSAKTRRLRGSDGLRNPCLIPDQGLPPVVLHTSDKGEVTLSENADPASLMAQIRNEEASPVTFAINLNLFVQVKIINLDCCLKRVVWCFTTQGMVTVGQEELVTVLETLPDEDTVPTDIFCHLSTVYEEAGKGNTVSHMGHSIFSQPFLDSGSHGGFLYLHSTFQCTNKLLLPPAPFLFPILLHKWETPWAKVFPIRLMLRLGAEHRYYPCPLVSIRNRKPVFFEIGHTIMNLLADFRNFQYMLQQIRGVSIHMEDQKTFINFPRNRYQDVMKVVSSSNEHVMALGASFSLEADSHLVCIQNEDGNYQTQAINIQNKPRQVTGASFVVFNGALKSSAGLRAKSSIVEDGLMVQILPEMMVALKQSVKDMKDFTIPCGPLSLPQPEEIVTLRWVDDDKNINTGVKSPVDGMSLEGVESVQVHNATDYVGERYAIRWTQLFFLQTESGSSRWEPVDLSRLAETLANAVCIALTPHLQKLREAALTKIGLRVTLQPDSVGYEVGSKGERLPDFYINDLDNALIPVIHGAISTSQDGPIVLELHLYLIH